MHPQRDDERVAGATARLGLRSSGLATDFDIARLEKCAGATLPTLFATFLRRFNGCANVDLTFERDCVLFDPIARIIDNIEVYEIVGMGSIPFAHDFFGGLWFLALRPDATGAPPGRIEFMAVQDRYIDPENPIEQRSPTFQAFLEGLVRSDRSPTVAR